MSRSSLEIVGDMLREECAELFKAWTRTGYRRMG